MGKTLHFVRDFDYTPPTNLNITYAYYAGRLYHDVPDDHAGSAIAVGAAIEPPAEAPEPVAAESTDAGV